MPVEPVTGVQRERNAGMLPCGLDGAAMQESLNKGPKLLGVETAPWNAVPKPDTRRATATAVSWTLLATEAPCTYAALLWRIGPADIPVADKSAACPTERTTKQRKTGEKQFYPRLGLEKYLHPRKVCTGCERTRPKTTGLNPMGMDMPSGTALRHRGLSHIPAALPATSIRLTNPRHYAAIRGNNKYDRIM